MSSLAVKKAARMEFKASPDLKDLLSEAAILSGQDLTAFVLGCAKSRALEVMAQHQSLKLAKSDQKRLLDLLNTPPEPSDALKDLMRLERIPAR